jgi:hypothetical protein
VRIPTPEEADRSISTIPLESVSNKILEGISRYGSAGTQTRVNGRLCKRDIDSICSNFREFGWDVKIYNFLDGFTPMIRICVKGVQRPWWKKIFGPKCSKEVTPV